MPRTIAELLADARRGLVRLEPEAALAAQRSGAVLVDTRSADERARDGVVPGALHVPLSVLPWRLDPTSKWRSPHAPGLDAHVVVLCAHGESSSLAAGLLQALGFARATDVVGGFAAWREAGLPVAAAGPPPAGLPGSGPPDG